MRHLICFGNELHGDDGYGPAVHRRMSALPLPPDLRLYLAGSRGLDALALFERCDEAILVDAAAPAGQPGRVFEPAAAALAVEDALPGHGAGVGYLLRALAALGEPLPALRVIAAEMAAIAPFRPGLSAPMGAAVDATVTLLCRTLLCPDAGSRRPMSETLPVRDLQPLAPRRWRGSVQFPNRPQPTAILIFELEGHCCGVRAHCPHEGYDLSHCPLDDEHKLICPRHGLAVCLRGADAFRLTRHGDGFAVAWPLECAS